MISRVVYLNVPPLSESACDETPEVYTVSLFMDVIDFVSYDIQAICRFSPVKTT